MLFHPILRDALLFPGLPHPRAVVCLCPLQVLTEAAVSPRLPLASCLSVRLSLRTERLQEASFLPPPLLASTHAHPAAGCPPAPAAAATRGRVPPPCALREQAGSVGPSSLGAKALGVSKEEAFPDHSRSTPPGSLSWAPLPPCGEDGHRKPSVIPLAEPLVRDLFLGLSFCPCKPLLLPSLAIHSQVQAISARSRVDVPQRSSGGERREEEGGLVLSVQEGGDQG